MSDTGKPPGDAIDLRKQAKGLARGKERLKASKDRLLNLRAQRF